MQMLNSKSWKHFDANAELALKAIESHPVLIDSLETWIEDQSFWAKSATLTVGRAHLGKKVPSMQSKTITVSCPFWHSSLGSHS